MKNTTITAKLCFITITIASCSSAADVSVTPSVSTPPVVSAFVTAPSTTLMGVQRSYEYKGDVYTLGSKGPGGGTVYYIAQSPFECGPELESTCSALEAAPTESEVRRGWANDDLLDKPVQGADRTDIGTGYVNTRDILRQGSTDPLVSGAAYADTYIHGGKDDWYLPSKDEFLEMYEQRDTIGGFSIADYWSSSEEGSRKAWSQFFFSGNPQLLHPKNHYTHYIRPIRAF